MNLVVNGTFRVEGAPPTPTDYDSKFKKLFEEFCREIGRNALVGTFDDFHESIFNSRTAFLDFQGRVSNFSRCVPNNSDDSIRRGEYRFILRLDENMFSDVELGFQKLVHVLVSDLFEQRGVGELRGQVHIESVDLGPVTNVFHNKYRTKSHTRSEIRHQFDLDSDEPLLAFSMKPRVGLTAEEYERFMREVFEGGFHLVEMDTRDLGIESCERKQLIERLYRLALNESQSRRRICRFSANLSGPFTIIEPMLEKIWLVHQDCGVNSWVLKIDGNLDGLSTIQAIRRWCDDRAISQPIITCYPVLKYGLARYLGHDTLYRLLVLSGADIIYPGGRPRFYADKAIDGGQVGPSRMHYKSLLYPDDYPLQSVAGGTLIGHVPAKIALLGTDIAFFVGGGLALSKKGLKQAAISFCEAVSRSRELLKQQEWSRVAIEQKFVHLTQVYGDRNVVDQQFELVNPWDLVDKVDELAINRPVLVR